MPPPAFWTSVPDDASRSTGMGMLRALCVIALCTGVSELMSDSFDLADIIMVYLAGVVYVALREGTAVSVASVLASIFLFDLIFVPPRWGLNPLNRAHFVTFGVMLVVGLLISRLAASAREHARRSADAQVAAETERLRSTVLSGISHDFRTPLTTIVGAATSLLEQDARLDERMRRSLAADILGEARRLHERVSDLLDLTRLEEGAVRLQCEWCPADDLVAESLQAVRHRTESHRVETDVAADAVVWCDPRLVEQALVNLVDNALRYSPAGSRIRIRVRTQGEWWFLTVADDGPGLPSGHEQAVFRKFERGHAEPAGTGFGLGLAICAAVARLHGGSIEGRNDGGAVVTMRFPQPPAPTPAAEDEA